MAFETPILFLVFNRPDTTAQVFEQIRAIQPKYLYVAADGPRSAKEGEEELCAETRRIATAIDWDCELKTLFREQNLGCGKAVSEAITWFFEQVQEGIILEDDCLPDISFFLFCKEILNRYRNDNRVMHISGNNFQSGQKRGSGDYYYSKYSHIWGWATWRRSWEKYDFTIKEWPAFQEAGLAEILDYDRNQIDYWKNIFNAVYENRVDTWDYQWLYSVWVNHGLCILPNHNIVVNIGFGSNATHTKEKNELIEQVKLESLFSISSPGTYDKEADYYSYRTLFNPTEPKAIKTQITLFPFLRKVIKKIAIKLGYAKTSI